MQDFRIALCQNRPGYDKQVNIDTALDMVGEAAAGGARLVVLPEIFNYAYELKRIPAIAEADGETRACLQQTARKLGIYLCTGTLAEREGERIFNRAYLIDPRGEILISYSKNRLFDVELPGLKVTESAVFSSGSAFPVAHTELGVIGILVCYDIRFPETARELTLQGAEILLVPAAFNHITGPAHWHITFRARAVENQCFVAAVSPALNPHSTYHAYGHSFVIDPWGRVLGEAGEDTAIVYADLEATVLTDTRMRLPLLKHLHPGCL